MATHEEQIWQTACGMQENGLFALKTEAETGEPITHVADYWFWVAERFVAQSFGEVPTMDPDFDDPYTEEEEEEIKAALDEIFFNFD